ncbi:hypothetical protein [Sphaerothrix gracilis]|uniref:hypothetical protein n=1 Tax=Sphaerothrix gracilis TaxID=3151835 RepID=UPI0031FC3BE4
MLTAVKALLTELIDYAGLFPPARLDLATAIARYRQHEQGPYRWLLGRFVLPLSQLEQLQAVLAEHQPAAPLPLSLILDGEIDRAIAGLSALKDPSSSSGDRPISITALELPPAALAASPQLLPYLPQNTEIFAEVPCSGDAATYLPALRQSQLKAKVRTGGLTPAAFPSPAQLSQFIAACAQAQTPFKATAGLHHPLPARRALTAAPDSPTAAMQGFLNVAIAAALLYCQKITPAEAQHLLRATALASWRFAANQISWGDRPLSLTEIQVARRQFFRSFGSCSLQEPIADLKALGLLG